MSRVLETCVTLAKRVSKRIELVMVFNDYTKRRVLFYHAKGYRAPTITT